MSPLVLWTLVALAAADDLSTTNALGPVKVETTLSPGKPVIGDEVRLEIKVRAEAGVEVLMPEFGEALNRYTILDFVPRHEIADDGASVFIQRYTLQPYLSGEQSIPPILIEFVDNRAGKKPAPDDYDAYEILTDRIDFTVESVLPKSAGQAMKPPLGPLELPSDKSPTFWVTTILVTLGTAGCLAFAVVAWIKRRRRGIRRNAYEIARARLDELLRRQYPQDEAGVQRFFVAISAIVRRYLEDRYDLRAPDLTTEEFLNLAGAAGGLSSEHQKLLQNFLRQADLVKFAGIQATQEEIDRSKDLAIRFLEETRENAPLIEASDSPEGIGGVESGGLDGPDNVAERSEGSHV